MSAYDLIIVGGGAAGLSAAAASTGRTLVIDRMGGGGELMNLNHLHDVEPGLTGPDLAGRLLEQAIDAGADTLVAEVTSMRRDGDLWHVATDDGESHAARAVILAVGLAPGSLDLPEEARFEGQGLSHCAACDGPLYAGEPVVVAGSDRWAVQEARDLGATASFVCLVTQGGAMEPVPGMMVLSGRITALEGSAGLEAVLIQPESGGPSQRLPAKAVFVQTNRRSALDFVSELERDAEGRAITDAHGRTNLSGLFAAGDARAGAERTLAAAINDGRRSALNAPLGNVAD